MIDAGKWANFAKVVIGNLTQRRRSIDASSMA
ncbi:Uncharacterised protein [Bacillus pumilus]|nr:Uncharacterised protein [Bacillus pumilus]